MPDEGQFRCAVVEGGRRRVGRAALAPAWPSPPESTAGDRQGARQTQPAADGAQTSSVTTHGARSWRRSGAMTELAGDYGCKLRRPTKGDKTGSAIEQLAVAVGGNGATRPPCNDRS
jgi:hypothetical protein